MSSSATRAAVLKWLADRIKEANEETRHKLAVELTRLHGEYGVKSIEATLGDESIATVTLTQREDSVAIKDEAEFATWAESVMPNCTMQMVKPEARAFLLDRMKAQGQDVFDSDTGDLLDFAVGRPGASFPTIRLKDKGAGIERAIRQGFNPLLMLGEGNDENE